MQKMTSPNYLHKLWPWVPLSSLNRLPTERPCRVHNSSQIWSNHNSSRCRQQQFQLQIRLWDQVLTKQWTKLWRRLASVRDPINRCQPARPKQHLLLYWEGQRHRQAVMEDHPRKTVEERIDETLPRVPTTQTTRGSVNRAIATQALKTRSLRAPAAWSFDHAYTLVKWAN